MDIEKTQKDLCTKHGAKFVETPLALKLGISLNVKGGVLPINGLRHVPKNGTSGWYIYAGEKLSQEDNFFKPIHGNHLKDWCPKALKYLGFAPGWRFLIAHDYEDVWFDPNLLTT